MTTAVTSVREAIYCDGFALVANVIDAATLDAVIAECGAITTERSKVSGGHRNLLARPFFRTLARTNRIKSILQKVLPEAHAVRAILFDKSPEANWKVIWHQDRSIAVAQRVDVSGFGPWSVKDGVQHVQPPAAVLEQMLTLRLHLDNCTETNGPLRVIPRSHIQGILDDQQIQTCRASGPECTLTANRGDVLLMRPLLLHASAAATAPAHRRVLHIEYASGGLGDGLKWYEDV
jgi:ectoine hydroxylase-related dioxygenase (phytanoyl-CoA dioxygenase family)